MVNVAFQKLSLRSFEKRTPEIWPSATVLDVMSGYNLVAASYDTSEWKKFWDRNEQPLFEKMLRLLKVNRKAKALDLGCGTGRYLRLLARFFEEPVGIDLSSEMLRLAKRRASRSRLIEADLNDIDWIFSRHTQKFKVITVARVLSHIEDPSHVIDYVCNSLLESGGVLMISDIHPEHAYDQTSFKHEGVEYKIKTFKHTPLNLTFGISGVETTYHQYKYRDLIWKPSENKLSSIDRTSERPIFYTLTVRKPA
jgi:2-polyprenyl-3-methyl-5-hydroxy-6-metoxy-1,4-benzoquinol methylase